MKLKLLVLALVASLSGCASLGTVDSDTAIDLTEESVFIIGVSPDNYRISVFPGRIEGNSFIQSTWRSAAVYAGAKEGYVIGKAKAGDVLAITGIRLVEDEDSLLGADFGACEGQKTMVFTVPLGKAAYLVDVHYDYVGNSLSIDIKDDIESAQAHLDKTLPDLNLELEQIEFQMLAVNRSCVVYY